MLDEINEIPERAMDCLKRNSEVRLPVNVPYIGMGSSYFAALAPRYAGAGICPEIASEFAYYLKDRIHPDAVLISQSGHSSETLWCSDAFASYTAIVNDPHSPLTSQANCSRVVELVAGEERHSSTKSYVNTLVALYAGLGMDPASAVHKIAHSMNSFEDWAGTVSESIHRSYQQAACRGILVVGSGPNYATAQQAALVLTETLHRPVLALTLAQYDHGPKECAENSIVLFINAAGPAYRRARTLVRKVRDHGALVWEWEQKHVPEMTSPLLSCIPFFFLAAYLSRKTGITETFRIGGKVTRVEQD